MKLEEFTQLSVDELERLDVPTLKRLVSEQGKKLNKRISNIRYNPEAAKISVNKIMRSGGKFGVRGKDEKSELIDEAKREINFAKEKTSTVYGARAAKKEIEKSYKGETSEEYGKRKRKEYEKEETKKKMEQAKEKGKKGLTKAQKKSIKKMGKKVEKAQKKIYDKRAGEAWSEFKKWKEKHPSIEHYNKEDVKSSIEEYAKIGDDSELSKTLKQAEKDYKKAISKISEPIWTIAKDKDVPDKFK